MAVTMAIKEGGGGSETVTTLWTNGSPSSSMGSATITLSESIDSFKKFRIRVKNYYSDSEAMAYDVEYPVWNEQSSTYYFIGNASQFAFGSQTSSATYVRFGHFNNGTTVVFASCQKHGGSGTANDRCIPLAIYGIN